MNPRRPGRVLFVCSRNSVRSPMAEQLLRAAGAVEVASAGLIGDEMDGFAVAALAELGLPGPPHPPRALDELKLGDFDIVIALSDDAEVVARSARGDSVERWQVPDPSGTEGNREQRMDAYRAVRDLLARKIRRRFGGETT
ncbi:MAG: low molecular weight phosphatase family protein [Rhodospirillales bacterium]|nr:low molecular weight phosphatase family protein [Rhodospirillales bacterium]